MPRPFAAFRDGLTRRLRRDGDASDAGEGPEDGGLLPVRLAVGLGNPDEDYADTRHNVGAWCIQLLARRHGARLTRQGRSMSATLDLDGVTLHLARPRAYVNESGAPVAAELRRLGLHRQQLIVLYDELDLPVGQLRIRPHGGHGGHNGMRSILGALGEGDFARIRIGIDRPYDEGRPVRTPDRIADWVLSAPPRNQRAILDEAVATAADAVEIAAREGIDRAMSRLNPS